MDSGVLDTTKESVVVRWSAQVLRMVGGRLTRMLAGIAVAGVLSTRPGLSQCTGDCNGDGSVGVGELVRCVSIALGDAPLGDCPRSDRDGDGVVRVNEVVAGIRGALRGCTSAVATPTLMALAFPTADIGRPDCCRCSNHVERNCISSCDRARCESEEPGELQCMEACRASCEEGCLSGCAGCGDGDPCSGVPGPPHPARPCPAPSLNEP